MGAWAQSRPAYSTPRQSAQRLQHQTSQHQTSQPQTAQPQTARVADRREGLRDDIATWITHPAMSRLVTHFGGTLAPFANDPGRALAYLDAFSSRHWEFRAGRERDCVAPPRPPHRCGHSTDKLVRDCAASLGLVGSVPPAHAAYDAVLILGGLVAACAARPAYAAALVRAGLQTDEVVALTAFRPLSAAERAASTALLGSVPGDEFSAMAAGVEQAFGLGAPTVTTAGPQGSFGSHRTHCYRTRAGLRVQVTAAPSSDPDVRRANTRDALAHWAASCPVLPRTVLVVTTAIYVPYQQVVARDVLGLGYGMDVETVAAAALGGTPSGTPSPFRWYHYAQEVRSTIRAMSAVYASISHASTP